MPDPAIRMVNNEDVEFLSREPIQGL